METLFDFILHLDEYLFTMIVEYGIFIYAILFLIIFVETGLVIMPFLPGDSLLFTAGAFCAGVINETGETAQLSLWVVLFLLVIAAILGDGFNYYLGKRIGLKITRIRIYNRLIVNQKYIDQTTSFYEKYGSKTIVLARFIPIVRTFAPFVAGIANMRYIKFVKFNIIGAIIWVFSLVLLGYYFGNLSYVRNNFETVIFAIIGLSVLPVLIEIVRNKLR